MPHGGDQDDGVLDLVTVDLVMTTSHKVSLNKLKAWLASSGHDPSAAAIDEAPIWPDVQHYRRLDLGPTRN